MIAVLLLFQLDQWKVPFTSFTILARGRWEDEKLTSHSLTYKYVCIKNIQYKKTHGDRIQAKKINWKEHASKNRRNEKPNMSQTSCLPNQDKHMTDTNISSGPFRFPKWMCRRSICSTPSEMDRGDRYSCPKPTVSSTAKDSFCTSWS